MKIFDKCLNWDLDFINFSFAIFFFVVVVAAILLSPHSIRFTNQMENIKMGMLDAIRPMPAI